MAYERITTDPDVMGGLPRIRDLRIPVATVIAMLADGMSPEEIVAELPDLTQTTFRSPCGTRPRRCASGSYRCGTRREIPRRRKPVTLAGAEG
jgi:Protein of unknown function (DUF433)